MTFSERYAIKLEQLREEAARRKATKRMKVAARREDVARRKAVKRTKIAARRDEAARRQEQVAAQSRERMRCTILSQNKINPRKLKSSRLRYDRVEQEAVLSTGYVFGMPVPRRRKPGTLSPPSENTRKRICALSK